MFDIFTKAADWGVLQLGLTPNTDLAASVHFFIEDTLKIFALLYFIIFFISLFRKQLSPQKVHAYIQGKPKYISYGLAVILGVITPFCTCSSVPLFIGFVQAGIPFGVTMAFLISSPLVSEIAAVLLVGTSGAGVSAVYIISGSLISMLGGYLCDYFNLGRFVSKSTQEKLEAELYHHNHEHEHGHSCSCTHEEDTSWKALFKYAHDFAADTVKETWIYILIGVGLGAAMHGYVPQEFITEYASVSNPWAVPFAAVIGAPLYGSHGAVIPVIDALLKSGVPLGTAMVVLMSVTAISLPEIMMLRKVLQWKILWLFIGYLLISFMVVGYILNFIYG